MHVEAVVDSDFGDTVAVLLAVRGSRYCYRELKDYVQRIEESLRTLRPVAKIRRVGEQPEEIQITSSLPVAVATALVSSFAVAMLLTPLLARFFIKKGLHGDTTQDGRRRFSPLTLMQTTYAGTIRFAMRHKTLALAGTGLALAAGVVMLRFVPRQFFPSAERNQFVIDVFALEGTRIGVTDELARRIEKEIAPWT